MIKLFPDQRDQIDRVAGSMRRGNKRVLMQAATGAGKTIMATEILHRAISKGSSTWFIVPRKELMRQTSKTYDKFKIPHSFIASGYNYDFTATNFVCSLQTLTGRLDKLKPPAIAIIDETHYGGAGLDKVIKWLEANNCYIIGLSATPKKGNGDGMDKWYQDLVIGLPMGELIKLGRLSEFKLFAPSVPDLSDIKIVAGDYNKKQMGAWMDDHGEVLIGDAVTTYKNNAMGRLGITFASSIKESKRTAQAYRDAGVPACHLDGTVSHEVRQAVINRFADRELLQIVSVDIMCFGFDLAAQVGRDVVIECMSDVAPTKSEAKQLQKWGRVLRVKDNPAQIFDHAGNVFEHGMPDELRKWTLKGRDKRVRKEQQEREIEMRQCKECYFCHPSGPHCPNCGNIYPIQSRVIKQVEGELEEIKTVQRKKEKRMEVGMAKSYKDLLAIENDRGYKKGWAYVLAKKKGLLK